MNRIDAKFAELKAQGRTALIPYITMGDPTPDVSLSLLRELELAGADIVELGVPYSDPLADGPVIQRASERALQHRITILDCMKIAKQAREHNVNLPFILFTYYNPVLRIGLETFFELLVEHDISGVIIPDLPFEENGPVKDLSDRFNVHLIPLVAPTSEDRIAKIVSTASGFIYCVSSLGVTGMRSDFFAGIDDFLATVRRSTELPIAIGFGISTGEQFKHFSQSCDGVVVGSAIVRKIEEATPLLLSESSRSDGLVQVREFVRQLRG
ncbi:tryptophan synthase subunit alpha [Paenibacillus flagellatus]|uniref:Tryptophan synthase alpha chain n=1 Tax=Paenibacillus flagellatus TaxID=2211139 RepID=A0A2V5K6B7_9BACL|nr:tryptophan synthase subunit alpha [Paenibacillus flagellatus]PYI54911.1 tryptophan synthase subunit alpha [Paenibacillus flagellatus]